METLPATNGDGYAILLRPTEDVQEIIRANVGTNGQVTAFDLDRVRIPTGGATQWTVPGITGDQSVKELNGIIVHWRDGRLFWEHAYGDAPAGPPDCVSNDCTQGTGVPGGLCAKCRYAQWESAPKGGKGQACKQVRLLFIIQRENILPMVLPLPPTSLQNARRYFLRLAGSSIPFYGVETKFVLEPAQNAGGIKYAKAALSVGRVLPKDELVKVRAYAQEIKTSLDKVQVSSEDYSENGEG